MRVLLRLLAGMMIVAGALWALPGLGLVDSGGEEPNPGVTLLGAGAVGFGLALIIVTFQKRD